MQKWKAVGWWYEIYSLASVTDISTYCQVLIERKALCFQILLELVLNKRKKISKEHFLFENR